MSWPRCLGLGTLGLTCVVACGAKVDALAVGQGEVDQSSGSSSRDEPASPASPEANQSPAALPAPSTADASSARASASCVALPVVAARPPVLSYEVGCAVASFWIRFSNSGTEAWDRGVWGRQANLGLNRDNVSRDDHGWFALAGYRVLPWVQLVIKREDFERPSVASFSRNRAWTGGVNLEFAAAKVRLIANYVSRQLGDADATGALITQLQLRF